MGWLKDTWDKGTDVVKGIVSTGTGIVNDALGGGDSGGDSSATGGGGGTGGNSDQDQYQTVDVSNTLNIDMQPLADATLRAAELESSASLGSARILSSSEIRAAELRAGSEREKTAATFKASTLSDTASIEAAKISALGDKSRAQGEITAAQIGAGSKDYNVSVFAELATKAGRVTLGLALGAGVLYLYTHKKV